VKLNSSQYIKLCHVRKQTMCKAGCYECDIVPNMLAISYMWC
jgi:hypothetical protein